MAGYRTVGPEKRDEINPQRFWHDMRRGGQKFSATMSSPTAAAILYFLLVALGLILPAVADVCFAVGIGFYFYIKAAHDAFHLPVKMPRQSKLLDFHELSHKGKPTPAMGTFYLGNDRTTNDEIWLSNRDAGVHFLCLGTTGSGKALRLDEPVLTPTGFRLMRDLKVDDLVMHPSGVPTRIIGVFPQGELKLFRITFEDGREMSVSGDHLWEVHGHESLHGHVAADAHGAEVKPRVLNTKRIKEILAGGKAALSIPLYRPDWDESGKDDVDLPVDPYVLGALLGDVALSGNILSFTSNDEEVIARVDRALSSSGVRIRGTGHHLELVDDTTSLFQRRAPFRKLMRDLGLPSVHPQQKFIPASYLSAGPSARLELLRGLMDTNGAAGTDGVVTFASSSLRLVEDVAKLARSVGAIAKFSGRKTPGLSQKEEYEGGVPFVVEILVSAPSTLFHLKRKKEPLAQFIRAQELKLGIVSVEELDEYEECQCIKVNAPDGLFVAGEYVVTHNTELLLGLCQNSLNQGSGFIFVDGKAQDAIAFKIFDLVRARGREDDFLVINWMTGAKDIIGPQASKITNTMNPMSYGSSGMISQIVVGLMSGGGGGDDMWKDRAISFVEALSPPLVYLRDHYNIMLDVNEYRKYFELDRLEELVNKGPEMYPGLELVLNAMSNYLINLPGYDPKKYGKRGGQGDDTRLQHGYITMQLTRAFTSLSDTYGHIVRVPLGEVFFPDLVKNRRILVVMLPSLEKTPSETANIGKIIVTALRNIMSEGLGAKLEGDRKQLENAEGRAMLPPYLCILDEYGYYAVKGFAVAFAQARSLGFICVVGGQDLASFQKESKEEAVSICGNALRLDERVLTPHGYRNMGDLQVGDYVVHQNGYPTRILGVFPQGPLALFRISFADGRFMDVSGDHLWEVAEPGATSKVLPTHEIMEELASSKRLLIPLYGPDSEFDAVKADRDRLRVLLDQSFARVGARNDLVIKGDLRHAAEVTALARSLGGWARADRSPDGRRSLRIGGQALMRALAITGDVIGAAGEPVGLEIVSVAPLGVEAECQCIKVESPDGLFIAGDYLVTHNTRIKLFGSIEDPEQTMKFVIETAGKAMIAKSGGYESEAGAMGMSYRDEMRVQFEMMDRINPSDIKAQTEGQFTIVWRDSTIRTKTYFVDPVKVSKVRLNHFIPVAYPTPEQMEAIEMATSGLVKRLLQADLSELVLSAASSDIDAAAHALGQAKALGLGVLEAGISTLVSVGIQKRDTQRKFREAMKAGGIQNNAPDSYNRLAGLRAEQERRPAYGDDLEDYSSLPGMLPDPSGPGDYDDGQERQGVDEFGGRDMDGVRVDDVSSFEQMNVFVPPKRNSGFGAEVLGGGESDSAKRIEEILSAPEDEAPLLDYNRTYESVQNIERALGASEEEAGAAARDVVKTIEDATRYPQSVPKEKSGDQVKNLLEDLIDLLGDEE